MPLPSWDGFRFWIPSFADSMSVCGLISAVASFSFSTKVLAIFPKTFPRPPPEPFFFAFFFLAFFFFALAFLALGLAVRAGGAGAAAAGAAFLAFGADGLVAGPVFFAAIAALSLSRASDIRFLPGFCTRGLSSESVERLLIRPRKTNSYNESRAKCRIGHCVLNSDYVQANFHPKVPQVNNIRSWNDETKRIL